MAWTLEALSSVSEIISGGTPKSGNPDFWGGEIEWLTPSDMGKMTSVYVSSTKRKISELGLAKSSAKLIPANSVILSTRAPIGHLAINTVAMATNQGCRGLIPRDSIVTEYLYYFLLHNVDLLNELGSGTTFKELSKGALEKVAIPVPPIEEQKRIVAILDQVFADIEKARATAETNLKNARELFDSYLQQVFSLRGEGWVESTLEEIVSEDCSLSYGIVQPGEEFNNGLSVVRPTDLTSKIIFPDGLKLIDPKLASSYQRTTLQGGELLLCVRGSTGTVSLASNDLKGANVTRGIVPVRFDLNKVIQKFGYYQFISKNVQKQISGMTYGTALMQINIRDVKKLKFSIPPQKFQQETVVKLDVLTELVDALEEIYSKKLHNLNELKKSILQKAFKGELTKSKGIAA